MEHIDRIFKLHNLLLNAHQPISRIILEEKLECSTSSVRRTIDFLRDKLGAPIDYDRDRNGYQYHPEQKSIYELPGLWLNESEIHALLTIQQMLNNFHPDLLLDEIKPFEKRIKEILQRTTGTHCEDEVTQTIHLMTQGIRQKQYISFQPIADACLKKQQLKVNYHARYNDLFCSRILSPQKMVYYKNNWYLVAWCHNKDAIRIFSLDKLTDVIPQNISALQKSSEEIDLQLFSSFGIFAGHACETAILQFSPNIARWIADETWHPNQTGEWLKNGNYQLKIPYNNSIELLAEILKYADDITVIAPKSLQQAVVDKLLKTLKNYSNNN
ncbi:MAG: WYL domain-containing protein [Methylococcales bacterium]|jgi:proteasome accessory factor C|nr:WYL domain-containing protein [Methylococcales bacterium]